MSQVNNKIYSDVAVNMLLTLAKETGKSTNLYGTPEKLTKLFYISYSSVRRASGSIKKGGPPGWPESFNFKSNITSAINTIVECYPSDPSFKSEYDRAARVIDNFLRANGITNKAFTDKRKQLSKGQLSEQEVKAIWEEALEDLQKTYERLRKEAANIEEAVVKSDYVDSLPTLIYPVLTGHDWIVARNNESAMHWTQDDDGSVCKNPDISCKELLLAIIPNHALKPLMDFFEATAEEVIDALADSTLLPQYSSLLVEELLPESGPYFHKMVLNTRLVLNPYCDSRIVNRRCEKLYTMLIGPSKQPDKVRNTISSIKFFARQDTARTIAALLFALIVGPEQDLVIKSVLERS